MTINKTKIYKSVFLRSNNTLFPILQEDILLDFSLVKYIFKKRSSNFMWIGKKLSFLQTNVFKSKTSLDHPQKHVKSVKYWDLKTSLKIGQEHDIIMFKLIYFSWWAINYYRKIQDSPCKVAVNLALLLHQRYILQILGQFHKFLESFSSSSDYHCRNDSHQQVGDCWNCLTDDLCRRGCLLISPIRQYRWNLHFCFPMKIFCYKWLE